MPAPLASWRACQANPESSAVDRLVLAVPVISADPATETVPALVRRLLALAREPVQHGWKYVRRML